MNKAEFLKELKAYLAVLKESEQVDILDEYAQHIDMKMERGMSEAEAIKDFGGIRELAAEILEAYHVNPQFEGSKAPRNEFVGEQPRQRMGAIRDRFRLRGKQIFAHLYRWGEFFVAVILRILKAPFYWIKKVRNKCQAILLGREKGELIVDEVAHVNRENWSQIPRKTARGLGQLGAGIIALCLWGIRWMWNGCMFFGILTLGGMLLSCLYGLGIVSVLLAQGYPLIGIELGLLGATMCTTALILFCIGLLRFKKSQSVQTTVEIEEKEEMIHA